jgi:hypothetical protein
MRIDDLLNLLRLPPATLRQWRVAKTDFAAQLKTPADRRSVLERVDSLIWHAALNPDRAALPAGGVTGLAVIVLTTKNQTPPPRPLLLVHRAVPDPILLVTASDNVATSLSVKPALGEVLSTPIPEPGAIPAEATALLSTDRAASLADLHRRWCQAVLGLSLVRSTGVFPPTLPSDHDAEAWQARRDALDRIVALDRQIYRLTLAARKAKQMPRRAELNHQLQTCRVEKDRLLAMLRT